MGSEQSTLARDLRTSDLLNFGLAPRRMTLEVYRALRETEAQRMGFESLDEAERIAGP